ncbi:glycosyltransferase family 4 protein [uncultured Anaerococcus sp.]|uniref:glycosyltransferase family 4 protein n=1 Tax=uncultured Anaerococcus sp. TaxID=293428 RepID=UPI00288A888E|nr:glycosyltransferase family 4 protein [uncultured Anaerococcus sp.]
MKIAFYINAIHEGGAERVMVNLANDFVNRGDEIILITSFKDNWEYPYSDKIKRYVLEENPASFSKIKRNINRVKELRKILKNERPDCLVSFMAEPNYRAIVASLGLDNKILISVRNDPEKEYSGIIERFLGKNLLPLADGCVFQTKEAQEWFPKKLQRKSKIIYNTVKDDFFNIQRNVEENTVVTCGRLEEQKNHKMLIDAFELVVKKCKDAKLFIYGEGSLRNELQNIIDEKELSNNIKLCGNSKDIPGVLRSADVFVLSSDYEGMPNALMEALAAGVPSISTDCPCGGPRMLIDNYKNGILTTPGNHEELGKALLQIIGNLSLKNKFSIESKNKAEVYRSSTISDMWYNYIINCTNDTK